MTKNCKNCGKPFQVESAECFGFDFSQTVTICSPVCLGEIHQKELEEKLEKEKQLKLRDSLRIVSRIQNEYPRRYSKASLTDFMDTDKDSIVLGGLKSSVDEIVNRWINSPYWCFFLRSEEPDTGKTRLGLVLLAELAKVGTYTDSDKTAFGYIKAPLIASMIESERFSGTKPLTNHFIESPVLFVDDLGTEKTTQSDLIAYILDEREQDMKKTILTTNLNNDNIALRYGGRFISRVKKGLMEKVGINRR